MCIKHRHAVCLQTHPNTADQLYERRARQRIQIGLARSMESERFAVATRAGPLHIPLQRIFI